MQPVELDLIGRWEPSPREKITLGVSCLNYSISKLAQSILTHDPGDLIFYSLGCVVSVSLLTEGLFEQIESHLWRPDPSLPFHPYCG